MKTVAVLGLSILVLAVSLSSYAQDKKGLDPAKLVGEWKYVDGLKDGEKVAAQVLKGIIKIDKKAFTLPSETPDEVFVMPYKLDASKSPAAIDFTIEKAPLAMKEAEGAQAAGIITLEGDTIKLAYASMGGERPKNFESTADNKVHVFTLKRK